MEDTIKAEGSAAAAATDGAAADNALAAEIEALADATVETADGAAKTDAAPAPSRAAGASAQSDLTAPAVDVASAAADASKGDAAQQPAAPEHAAADDAAAQALFDRAIRAGISSADLFAMKDPALVERMVALAEKANGVSQEQHREQGSENAAGAGKPADDLEAALARMEEDGDYDANLMQTLKGLVNENRAMKSARETAERQAFFDGQLKTLDEGVRSHVDAAHKSMLKAKFDLLMAGYGASGAATPSREQVFQEAARLALGDLMGRAAEERKAAALDQRRNLTLARPGGENGARGGASATDDPFADFVAAMG